MTAAIAGYRHPVPSPPATGVAVRRRSHPLARFIDSRTFVLGLLLLVPVERVLVLDRSGQTLRPVYLPMALLIGRHFLSGGWRRVQSPFGRLIVAAHAGGAATMIVALTAGIWPYAHASYGLWAVFDALFAIAALRAITRRPGDFALWVGATITATTWWAAYSVVQWCAAFVVPSLAYSFAGPVPRVHALTLESSALALYLLPGLFLAMARHRTRPALLIALAMVLSTSRLGLVGVVAGLLAAHLVRGTSGRRRFLRIGAKLALGALMALPFVAATPFGGRYLAFVSSALNTREQSSTAPRLQSWAVAAGVAGDRPLLGVGPSGLGDAVAREDPDSPIDPALVKTTNLWLETAAELGLIGVLALGAWTFVPLVALQRRSRGRDETGVLLGAIAIVATYPLFQTWWRPSVWFAWTLVLAAAARARHGARNSSVDTPGTSARREERPRWAPR